VGKLTPVRPSAIRAPVSSFNFNQAGVASETNALLDDTSEELSGNANAALLGDFTDALSGDTAERFDNAFSLKGQ
jgi:hypothetical protein